MRVVLLLALLILMPNASDAQAACVLRWPNPQIPVPAEVERFIAMECHNHRGVYAESVDDCIRGEAYGYRGVVTMLMDAQQGERAAERYRACRSGLGAHGGRFHRRRAECVGGLLGYVWRFEFSRQAWLAEPIGAEPPLIVLAEQSATSLDD